MTPTEQDKELRELLERYAETIETDDGEYLAVDIDHVVEPIMHLITADRKRVALEARIDELLHLVDESSDTTWKANAWFSVRDRMAELKSQQEEA
jgi:hypothetical protein